MRWKCRCSKLNLCWSLASCLLFINVQGVPCGSSWKPYNGSCFLLSDTNKNFAEARKYCFREGGFLASVRTGSEYSFLVKTIQLLGSSYQRVRWYIGLHQFEPHDNHKFRWLDGSVSRFRHWMGSQPNNVHERCTQLDGSAGFRWRDELCHQRSRFICRKDPGSSTCHEAADGAGYSWRPADGGEVSATECLEHCRGQGRTLAAPRRDTCYCPLPTELSPSVDREQCVQGSCGGMQHCGHRDLLLVFNLTTYPDLARNCEDLASAGVTSPGIYQFLPEDGLEPVFSNCFGSAFTRPDDVSTTMRPRRRYRRPVNNNNFYNRRFKGYKKKYKDSKSTDIPIASTVYSDSSFDNSYLGKQYLTSPMNHADKTTMLPENGLVNTPVNLDLTPTIEACIWDGLEISTNSSENLVSATTSFKAGLMKADVELLPTDYAENLSIGINTSKVIDEGIETGNSTRAKFITDLSATSTGFLLQNESTTPGYRSTMNISPIFITRDTFLKSKQTTKIIYQFCSNRIPTSISLPNVTDSSTPQTNYPSFTTLELTTVTSTTPTSTKMPNRKYNWPRNHPRRTTTKRSTTTKIPTTRRHTTRKTNKMPKTTLPTTKRTTRGPTQKNTHRPKKTTPNRNPTTKSRRQLSTKSYMRRITTQMPRANSTKVKHRKLKVKNLATTISPFLTTEDYINEIGNIENSFYFRRGFPNHGYICSILITLFFYYLF